MCSNALFLFYQYSRTTMSCPLEQTWNIPSNWQQNNRYVMLWPRYLYKAIMKYDERLHTNKEICDAFNHLVATLDQFQSICYTYTPEYMMENYEYILLYEPEPNKKEWERIPVRFYRVNESWLIPFGNRVAQAPFVPQIYEAYMPLYDLMEKYGMLSWVRKHRERVD